MVCFAAAAVVGLSTGNPIVTVIWRATLIMLVAWAVGRAVGFVMQQTVDDHVASYKENNPISDEDAWLTEAGDAPSAPGSPAPGSSPPNQSPGRSNPESPTPAQ